MIFALLISWELCVKGYAASIRSNEEGGHGGNFLCLTDMPNGLDTSVTSTSSSYGAIWGVNYEFTSTDPNSDLDESGVPCALCQIQSRNSFMIPGTDTCPANANTEYVGNVMSGTGMSAPEATTQYICVSEKRETSGVSNHSNDGSRLGLVRANCLGGYLPCAVYPDLATLPCVVCSN